MLIKPISVLLTLEQLRENQWKSREELEAMQNEKLEKLIQYAREKAPHYKKNKYPRVRDIRDLSEIPFISKKQVQDNPEAFISSDFGKESLVCSMTSGSTGMPLRIFQTHPESKYGPAFELLQFLETGVGPLDAHAWISADRYEPNILDRLGLFRRRHFLFTDAKKLLMDMKAFSPTVLRGTPSFLLPLASENARSKIGLCVKKAYCFSEVLSKNARDAISASFGCEVFDSYGSIETSWIAWQCVKGSMHIFSDQIIAEILDDEGRQVREGDYGNIVLTPLWRRAMPLIRYSLNDRAAFGKKCACGRGSLTLKSIEGRCNDVLTLPSSKPCSAHIVSFNLRGIPGILQFQTIQEDLNSLRVLVVSGSDKSAICEEIKKSLNCALPEKMDIRVEFVDALDPNQRGKLRDFISKVKPPSTD